MKPSRIHTVRIIALSIALFAMLLLAMGVSQIELAPGVPFTQIWQFLLDQLRGTQGPPTGMAPLVGNADLLIKIMQVLFFITLIAFPFAVIMVIIDPELRKRVLRTMLVMILLFAVAGMYLDNLLEMSEEETEDVLGVGSPMQELEGASAFTDEEFSAESVPAWIPLALSLGAGLIVAIIVVTVVRQIRRDRAARGASLAPIARRAESAINEIQQGGDLRNTILRCYAEMTQIVQEQRGLRRANTVTAREFSEHLLRAKLPPGAVTRLTQLFESARYGVGKTGPQDEVDAIASLQAIVDACGVSA